MSMRRKKDKMKTILLQMVIAMSLGMAAGDSTGAISPSPELARVIAALQPITATLAPLPEIKANGGSSITISYRTQIFKIHGYSMTGEFTREAHDEIGPTFKGFVLFVDLQPKGEVNQAATPQTLRKPYWQTYIQVTPVFGSSNHLYWGLSYGSQTEPKILAQIRLALEGLKELPKRAP